MLPPPGAPPIASAGACDIDEAAIHNSTNAQITREVEWNVSNLSKRWKRLGAAQDFLRDVDDSTKDLVALLGTRIGMIMEYVIDAALTLGQ